MKKIILILLILFSFSVEAADKSKLKLDYVAPTNSNGLVPADGTIGDSLRDGTFRMAYLPHYMIYLMDFFTKIAGTFSVLMILWAGFQYAVSGVTEEKESAKNSLKYALVGLAVTFWAWIGVNMVQIFFTTPG